MKHASEQYLIDFSSRTNDRCAKLSALRELQLGISPGRLNGVIELLQRLTVLSRYLPEDLNESYTVEAQVSAIASRIHARHSVSEKTVRNWTFTAVKLGQSDPDANPEVFDGCLAVDYRSQKFGGRSWNVYQINFASVLALLAGNGRKWPVTVSALGAVTVSDPGAVMVSAPLSVLNKSFKKEKQHPLQTSHGTSGTAQVVVVSLEVVLDECGLLNPTNTLRQAREVLRLSNSEIEARIAAYKARPEKQQHPGVLNNWLTKPRSYSRQPFERKCQPTRPRRTTEEIAAQLAESDRLRREAQALALTEPSMEEQFRVARNKLQNK